MPIYGKITPGKWKHNREQGNVLILFGTLMHSYVILQAIMISYFLFELAILNDLTNLLYTFKSESDRGCIQLFQIEKYLKKVIIHTTELNKNSEFEVN